MRQFNMFAHATTKTTELKKNTAGGTPNQYKAVQNGKSN